MPQLRTQPGRAPGWLLAPAWAVVVVSLLPLGYLLVRLAEADLGKIGGILLREQTASLVLRSLGLVVTVTLGSLVLGIGLAVLIARTDLPGRRALAVLAPLPLAVPSYVAAFAWVSALPSVAGFTGAALVLTLCCYPYVLLPVVAALRRVDPALEDVARTLGRSPARAFREATLPQIAPAATAGALLVALYTLADFGAVSILRFDAFTRVIHTSYQASFDRTTAAVLGLVLVAITLVISLGEATVRGRGTVSVTRGTRREPTRFGLDRARWLAVPAFAVVVAAVVFPIVALLWWFATGLSAGVDGARLGAAVGWTLWFAVLATGACLLGAVPVGILAARHRGRFSTAVEQSVMAGHALPGLVVALALVFFGVRVVPGLYQRTPLLVLGLVVLLLPAAIGSVRSAVAQSAVALEEVARSLGDPPLRVLRRVTLPLALPGIAAGGAMVLLTAMKELPATVLLRPTGVDTLATRLWTETGSGAYAAAAPYGLAIVLIAVLPTVVLMRATGAREIAS